MNRRRRSSVKPVKITLPDIGSKLTFYRLIILILHLFLLFPLIVSATQVNPAALPTAQNQSPLEILWKERDGKILVETVCFNYPVESDLHQGCKNLARQKFRDECNRFSALYNDSRPYYLEEYRLGMEKFCGAVNLISP